MLARFDSLWHDMNYVIRTLRRAPRYAAATMLSLALGIGVMTIVVSLVDHIVIRPLPFASPDRLVVVREVHGELKSIYPTIPANASHFLEWRRSCSGCAGLAAIKRSSVTLSGDGDPQRLGAVRVSANLFSLLGVQPSLGRGFREEEDQPGHNGVVVLSDASWRRHFGGDPSIIGRRVILNGASTEIIGVLPRWARLPGGDGLGALVALPGEIEVYQPLALSVDEATRTGGFDYAVIARIRDGVNFEAVRVQLDAIESDFARRAGDGTTLATAIVPLKSQVVGLVGRPMLLLLVAAAAVLLIVCVNLVNLTLARSMARQREAALRVALGAGTGRLTRLPLLESLALAATGGALGLLLAWWGLRELVPLAPPDLPRIAGVTLDGRMIIAGVIMSAVVGLLIGALPAIQTGRISPSQVLAAAGGRTMSSGRAAGRRRTTIIVAQVAFSTLLLIGAGLFLTSFLRVISVDPGVDTIGVVALDVALPSDKYPSGEHRWAYYQRALAEIATVPTLTGAAAASALPLEGESWVDGISRADQAVAARSELTANFRFVSPGYFGTIGTALVSGREFETADKGRRVAVVSQRTAATLWPDGQYLGRRINAGRGTAAEVIGVAVDARTSTLEAEASLVVYLPIWEAAPAQGTVLARVSGMANATSSAAVRAALRRVDPTVVVPKVRTMAEVVSATLAARRFQLALLLLLATLAFVTTSIGIYGVISQSLLGRSHEIGVRMAVGAQPADIIRLVMREGLTSVALGLAFGVGGALAAGRVVASLLFGVTAHDSLVLASVAFLILSIGAIACAIPAWRAVRMELPTLLGSS